MQSPRRTREGKSHPDRNAQFEHINDTAEDFLRRGQPVISVDTKKKEELVGNFKNAGREWHAKGEPKVLVHDFPTDAVGKAIPYGVYDMARNEAYVSVGCDHDTADVCRRRDSTVVGDDGHARVPEAEGAAHHCRRGREQRLSLALVESGAAETRR